MKRLAARLAADGQSFGAYWATKLSILERARLKRVVLQTPPVDACFQKTFLRDSILGNREYLFGLIPAFLNIFEGAKTVDDVAEMFPKMSLVNQRLLGKGIILRSAAFCIFLALRCTTAFAQGGPPYYTTDPGTPGNLNWEINFGYMPFLYTNQAITHTPDVDINFGLGDRIQLTYENAWLRVHFPSEEVKYGMEQSILGVKWRFYDGGENGFKISLFPQASVNNPNDSVNRGITPRGASLLLPLEFSKKIGPLDVNWEIGYNRVHLGPSGWIAGLVVGHELTKKLEVDAEFYNLGTYNPSLWQPTLEMGARYRIHRPFIILLMAGRGAEPASTNQSYFVGYFGVQVLLPPKSYDVE